MEDQGFDEYKDVDDFEYAGFWIRTGASIIDSFLMMLVIVPLLLMIYGDSYFESEELTLGFPDFAINHMFPLLVTVLFWVYKAATPGKMLVKVQVVDAKTGGKITVLQSIIRYVGYFLASLPLGLGILWVGWDSKKQGWHDKLAGTVVIRPTNKGVDKVTFIS